MVARTSINYLLLNLARRPLSSCTCGCDRARARGRVRARARVRIRVSVRVWLQNQCLWNMPSLREVSETSPTGCESQPTQNRATTQSPLQLPYIRKNSLAQVTHVMLADHASWQDCEVVTIIYTGWRS